MAQTAMVLAYLKKHKTITPMVALRKLNCFRLAARIFDLKTDGYQITTKIKTDKKNNKRWAEYMLKSTRRKKHMAH